MISVASLPLGRLFRINALALTTPSGSCWSVIPPWQADRAEGDRFGKMLMPNVNWVVMLLAVGSAPYVRLATANFKCPSANQQSILASRWRILTIGFDRAWVRHEDSIESSR